MLDITGEKRAAGEADRSAERRYPVLAEAS
jgi:hypothetical protein